MKPMQRVRKELSKYPDSVAREMLSGITDLAIRPDGYFVRMSEMVDITYMVSHPVYTKESGNVSRVFRMLSNVSKRKEFVELVKVDKEEFMILVACSERFGIRRQVLTPDEKNIRWIIKC